MDSAILQSTWGVIALTALTGLMAFIVFLRAINARRNLSSQNRPPKVETVHDKLRLGPESVFRVQGLPITHEGRHVDAREAEKMIRKALDVDSKIEVDVRSLAQLPSPPSQTATVTFSEIPPALDLRMQKHSDPEFTFRSSTGMVRLTVDTHFKGFTPLQSPSDANYSLDVIVLPGLGGHPFWSFKARGNDFMWLRDGLRESLPAARVFTYGYDTRLQRSDSFQSLQDLGLRFGHALASQIRAGRRASQAMRPIVFIGQSLGGLVVKEALCKLSDGRSEEANILKCVEAIFFFGTPNSGMDISSLIPIVSGQPNEQFLRSVEKESPDLRRQGERWHEITQHEASKYVSPTLRIFSFYETVRSPTAAQNGRGEWKMTGPPTVLVERTSATHGRPWETGDNSFVIPVDRSHSDMAKFKSASDDLYGDIVSWLEDILGINQSSYIDGRLSQEENELLSKCQASLYFPDQETHRHQITDAENNTCEWILKDKTYTDWVNSSSEPLLWIEGHAGAGKSTILKHALRQYESDPPHQAIVASYFFYGRGTKLQKTPQGLYQKLLYQLLPHFPRTFWGLVSRCEEQNIIQPQNSWTWTLEELSTFLYQHLPEACQRRPITIFIDALDECPGTSSGSMQTDLDDGPGTDRGELVQFIQTLSDLDQTGKLKVCVSCRYYPNLFTRGLRIPVEKGNRQDIATYVKHELSSLRDIEQTGVEHQIITRAQGIFQWAVLVSFKAIQMSKEGKTAKMIESAIADVPKSLDKLYEGLLENSDDREQTLRLFQWICYSEEPLNLLQLRWILVLSPAMKEQSIEDCINGPEFRTSPEQLCSAIRYLSKGLVEFNPDSDESSAPSDCDESSTSSDPRQRYRITTQGFPATFRESGTFARRVIDERESSPVFIPHRRLDFEIEPTWLQRAFLVHQSVKDYLCQKGFLKLGKLEQNENLRGRAHSTIARSCLSYIFLRPQGSVQFLQPQQSAHEVLSKYLKVWILHCFQRHVALAEWDEMDQLPILQDFCSPCHQTKLSRFQECLQECDIRFKESYQRTRARKPVCAKLHGAQPSLGLPFLLAHYGVTSALQHLLEYNNSRLKDGTDLPGKSEVIARIIQKVSSAKPESESPALEVLSSGLINLNQKSWGEKWTPLHIAAYHGYVDIVKGLLGCPTVNPNEQDEKGHTALHHAVRRGQTEVVDILLNLDTVDPNIKCTMGFCALKYHRFYGSFPILQSWVLCPRVDLNIQDKDGQSSPFYFIKYSFATELLRMPEILSRMNPNIQDNKGETLLHKAIYSRNFNAACALLEIPGIDKNLNDRLGRPPLFLIFNVPWDESNYGAVKALISQFDLLARDRNGSTLLHLAASRVNLGFVQMILEDGRISPEETDYSGQTVISVATSALRASYDHYMFMNGHLAEDPYARSCPLSLDEWERFMELGTPEENDYERWYRKEVFTAKRKLELLEEASRRISEAKTDLQDLEEIAEKASDQQTSE
ncbi:hypothetical protein IWZ00DRAFT_488791 [Phyllosticta capitalensis]